MISWFLSSSLILVVFRVNSVILVIEYNVRRWLLLAFYYILGQGNNTTSFLSPDVLLGYLGV